MVIVDKEELLPAISVNPESLTHLITQGLSRRDIFVISNSGSTELSWLIDTAPADCAEPSDVTWVKVDPDVGETDPDDNAQVEVTLNAAGLLPEVYNSVLCFRSNDPDSPVIARPLSMIVITPTILIRLSEVRLKVTRSSVKWGGSTYVRIQIMALVNVL
jgi:hypothetical protein